MKWMKRLRLVNWHFFQDEILEFGRQTLISGRNGTGKSTIIDALQVLFVADQRQIRFNSSAHDDAKRTLLSYLRGKIGGEERGFLRDGDFNSYILAEFVDESKKEAFVVGVVMDVYRDNSPPVEEYFILGGIRLAELDLVGPSGSLRNREEFRRYATGLKIRAVFERNKSSYQKAFRARMGQLHERFFAVFTKALSFKPIQNVRDFVYNYILDERELQLDLMKRNFELHERYEVELKALQERKDKLQQIAAQFEQYARLREIVSLQEYVIRRLKYVLQSETQEQIGEEISGLEKELAELEDRYKSADSEKLAAEKNALNAYQEWRSHDTRRREEDLKNQISGLEKGLKEKQQLLGALQTQLERELELLAGLAEWDGNNFWQWEHDEEEKLQEAGQLLAVLPGDGVANEEVSRGVQLTNVGEFLAGLHTRFTKAAARVEDRLSVLEAEKDQLEQQIRDLENKKRPYPESVQKLKALLDERLAGRSPVWIFCEEAEILDESWRNAVEGYLHTKRFDLLVEPSLFAEALRTYEQEKWRHRLEGVGLVDTEREQKYLGSAQDGSLAGVMQSDNPIIQARIDHLLGRVMQAVDEQELRRHWTAVTQTCMAYHNLVARQIEKERYRIPYIGAQAITRQLEIKRAELAEVQRQLQVLRTTQQQVNSWASRLTDRISIYSGMADKLSLPSDILLLTVELETLRDELAQLDLSEVAQLKQNYEYWQKHQRELEEKIRGFIAKKAERGTELQGKINELSEQARLVGEALQHWEVWSEEHPPDLFTRAEERWHEADRQELPVVTKVANWEGSQKGNQTRADQVHSQLQGTRYEYNSRYGFSGDARASDNEEYAQLLAEIETVDIPQYQAKLDEARRQSEEEFKSHFIYKLREAIEMARREFMALNHALKSFPFSDDRYHFEVKASERYRRFHDVIMDPLIVERGSLFDLPDEEKAQTLQELFEMLIKGEVEEQEEFTDYRRYLDFDLVVTSGAIRYSFSQVIREKSGGETQTPFYIAILASFNHLYSSGKSLRLVVFDEAFNKMDEERIQTSLRLIKQMNLQLIAAVPDEKMAHMVPEVTTTLVVSREKFTCFVDMLSQEEEAVESREILGPHGKKVSQQDSLFTSGKI